MVQVSKLLALPQRQPSPVIFSLPPCVPWPAPSHSSDICLNVTSLQPSSLPILSNVALLTWLVIPHSINLLITSGGSMVKEPAYQCRRLSGDAGLIPWRRTWQPTPVFLPGKSRGQRSLAGYSPWGCKESNMTEQLSTCIITYFVHLPMTCSFPYTQHVNSTRVGSIYALILLYVFCLAQCLSRVIVI